MPFLLGISGGSASGKSTLSKMIADKFSQHKTEIINADTYYKRGNMPLMKSPLTGIDGLDWNTPDAVDFDAMFGYFTEKSQDSSLDILIIEGAFIFCYETLRNALDLKIYLDLDSDIRMYRRIKRNMEVRGLSLEEIADYYTEYAKFSEQKNTLTSKIYADIIFNGHNYNNKAFDILINYLESNI
jgi:Uridine kinase